MAGTSEVYILKYAKFCAIQELNAIGTRWHILFGTKDDLNSLRLAPVFVRRVNKFIRGNVSWNSKSISYPGAYELTNNQRRAAQRYLT